MSVDLEAVVALNDDIDPATADRGDTVDPSLTADDTAAVVEDPKPEETPAVEDEPKPKAKDEDVRIPKTRFDEAVRKERDRTAAAEARARDLEAQLATQRIAEDEGAARTRLREMIKTRNNLLADGELDKASEMDENILDFQTLVAERQAEIKAGYAKEAAKAEIRYDAVVAKLEIDFPQINPDSDLYDETAVNEIKDIMDGFVATKKYAPAQALQKATALVLGAAKKANETAKDVGVRRKEEAVARNLAAAKKQPASTNGVGVDSDKLGGALTADQVMKMTQDEFAKLPESVLSKMRGDALA
jgi:hypothetical protein